MLIHTSSICNIALHDLDLIKLTVDRFVGTVSFLIIYSNGHTKLTWPIKEVPRLFLTNNEQISKLKNSHYINVSTDPLGTGHGSFGLREALWEQLLYRKIIAVSSEIHTKHINTVRTAQ
jgi:hypothetical protein